MSSRRGTRAQSREPQPVTGGAAVRTQMPPIPTKINTSYGSPLSSRLRNPNRGQRRDLRSVVDRLLDDNGDDDDEDENENSGVDKQIDRESSSVPESAKVVDATEIEPEPELVVHPGTGNTPKQPRNQQTSATHAAEAKALQSVEHRPKTTSDVHPPPLQELIDESRRRLAGFETGKRRRAGQKSGQSAAGNARNQDLVAHGAISGPLHPASNAVSSLPAGTSRVASHTSLWPEGDTSRSYGAESGVFGSATLLSTPASRAPLSVFGNTPSLDGALEPISENDFETRRPATAETLEYDHGPPEQETPSNGRGASRKLRNQPKPRSSSKPSTTNQVEAALPSPQQMENSLKWFGRSSKSTNISSRSDEHSPNRDSQTKQPHNVVTDAHRLEQSNPRFSLSRLDSRAEAQAAEDLTSRITQEQKWTKLTSFFSWSNERPESPDVGGSRSERNVESTTESSNSLNTVRHGTNTLLQDPGEPEWTAYLNPFEWIKILIRLFWGAINLIAVSSASLFENGIRPHLKLIGGIVTILSAVWLFNSNDLVPTTSSVGSLHWYGWEDFSHNLGQLIPFRIRYPLSILSDGDTTDLFRQLREYEYEVASLRKASRVHDSSLLKLEQIVPKVIHMKLGHDGKPVISQEFWHALADMIRKDGSILSFTKDRNGYQFASDEQWLAIKKRIESDHTLGSKSRADPNKSNISTSEANRLVEETLSRSWEGWLRSNEKKVAEILRPHLPSQHDKNLEKELQEQIDKILKTQVNDSNIKDVVVTKEEFIRHLKTEFAVHRNEIKAEILELEDKLTSLVQGSVDAAVKELPPAGLTRHEVTTIVDTMIRKAIANAGLEALAKGKINANFDQVMQHQVNYFSLGSHAIVDPKHTSPTFQRKGTSGGRLVEQWKRSMKSHPATAALVGWEDVGDCWCGAKSVDRYGSPLGVFISIQPGHTLIPQHVVVEHILPGATLDPDARPRDIEVWAYIEELFTRNRVMDFSSAHFPVDSGNRHIYNDPHFGDGYVKIGQFVYESSNTHNGRYIHQLSQELIALNAVTDNIILRAVTNYGSDDHTCFYRIRLFGEKEEF
jgi:hypothetical protein